MVTKSQDLSGYSGPDRRRRLVCVTRNTEYHLDGWVCVAVRERSSGRWLLSHVALSRSAAGLRLTRRDPGALRPGPLRTERPRVGDVLLFQNAGAPEVLTSNLVSVSRPEKATIEGYPV